MIQMLRKESCSGSIDDLAHVVSVDCLSDSLTKMSAKADALIKAIKTGVLPNADRHPAFRTLMKHKAYLVSWLCDNISKPRNIDNFLDEFVPRGIAAYLWNRSKGLSLFSE